MKAIVLSILSATAACLALSHAQELQTITEASGPLAIPANSIVQIVGVTTASFTTSSTGSVLPSITMAFADGTSVANDLVGATVPNPAYYTTNLNIVGNVFAGLASISIKNGVIAGNSKTITTAVTVKIMSEASQVVSPPMILPVDDEIFSISLETSTDMQDWVPAFPGDYLGSSNHRFFRVKAIQKIAAAPVAE